MAIVIDQNLKKFAYYQPTKRTFSDTVQNMCDSIEKNEIVLPIYQRDASWIIEKSVALLNYQLLGKAPVSPISINEIHDLSLAVAQISFVTRQEVEIKTGTFSVVDGQQRLSTNYKAYTNHEDLKDVYLDLCKGRFMLNKKGLALKKGQIPVGVLLNKNPEVRNRFMKEHKEFADPETSMLIMQIVTKMHNYAYTINRADDLTAPQQIQWFEVLNNAGSRVTSIEINFSKLQVYGIDIYKDFTKPFVEAVDRAGFTEVWDKNTSQVSSPVAAMNAAYVKICKIARKSNCSPMPSDEKSSQISMLEPDIVKQIIEKTLEALEFSLLFIYENDLEAPKRMDYISYLLGFFVFNGCQVDEATTDYLTDWYKKIDFANKSNTDRREIFNKLLSYIKE